jgi:hypothetical protein
LRLIYTLLVCIITEQLRKYYREYSCCIDRQQQEDGITSKYVYGNILQVEQKERKICLHWQALNPGYFYFLYKFFNLYNFV